MKKFIYVLGIFLLSACSYSGGGSSSGGSNSSTDTLSGSYSKIVQVDHLIYAINSQFLSTIDVTNPEKPVELSKIDVGFDIENIVFNAPYLIIGSAQHMYIYEVTSKGIPVKKVEQDYFDFSDQVCTSDPVIARQDRAYVTLSSLVEDKCNRAVKVNELRVYDISDFDNLKLLSTTTMKSPKGLAFDRQYLFVCDQKDGFSVFDISNKDKPVLIRKYESGTEAYDVIAADNLLTIVNSKKIKQYDYSDIENIQFLSEIDL